MPPSRGSEPLDIGSMSRSRSTSFSSDSQFPRNTTLAPPPDTTPPPAFIAAPAASQIITADQEFNTVDFVGDEEQEDGSGALVSPDALVLLNNFLDHLLFNILAVSKSTQLSSIRPAVADVLKPRLAKEVVSAADDELSDYMGGEGDEQFDFRGGQKPAGDFDLIRSWKRTRLRCMVYTRLGDMEEDEEDEYIARDGLVDTSDSPRRFASHVDIVTPAAAIFLTSIIEHLGEQALIIAGETSRSRLSTKLNLEHDEVTESGAERGRINRLVVEGHDMEKLAMNSTLGRLWRTWRKRTRAPKLSRTLSRESFRHRGIASTLASSRKSSVATIDELPARSVTSFDTAEAHEEEVDPAAVPLPISQHDVQEISIPGFSAELVGEIQTMEAVVAHKVRPRSLMVLPSPLTPRSPSSVESSPVVPSDPQRSKLNRHARSQSLPNNYSPPDYEEDLKTPVAESSADQRPASAQQISSPTPSEERRQLETMYEQEEPSDPAQTANTGLAISTPVATEATKESEADSPSRKRRSAAARNSMFAPSLSGASVVVEVSRPGSAQTAYPAEEAQRNAETIEGHGTVEKPRPASAIQRPRRKASGDPARKAERDRSSPSVSATNTTSTSERVVEERSRAQGARDSPTHVQKGPADKLSKDSNARKSVNQSWFLNNDDEDDATAATAPAAATATAATATAVAAAAAAPTVGQPSAEPSSLTSATGGLPSLTTNRAAVHRVPGQPPTPSKSRRSDSLSDKRPVTSGSSTSQVSSKLKDMVGRSPQGEAAPPHGRNSSEASGQSSGQHSPGLEQLIKSDETIHYTLTPKNMRDMEQPDSSRWKANRSSTADLATFLKTTAPPGDEVPRTTAPKASPKPSSPKPSSKPSSPKPSSKPSSPKPSSKPSSPKTNVPKYQSISDTKFPSVPRSKMATSLARDAKPANDSTRDFADFIKSTGPAGPPGPTTPTTPASAVDAPKSRTSSSSRGRRLSDSTDFSKKFIRPGSGLSGSTRGTSGPRLQARAAVAPKGEQTSDLIDFIREGPPTPGSHRISRSVAPFRNTMDSDDMNNSTVRESRTSTPDEPAAGKSLTSFGASAGASSTGGNAEKKPTPAPAPVPAPAPKTDDFDAPMPARKQRRVPDPYAIDDDDDEELEELLGLQEKPKREEESLIDFLRNATPPPQDPTPPSSIITNTKATTKSSSSTGMRARFLRSASEKMPASKPSKSSLRSTQTDPRSNGGQSNYIVKPTGGSKPPQVQVTHGPPAMPKRETETSALADFLKNSEPPEPPRAPSAFAMNRGKDTNGLSRFLMRKKKVDV